MLKAFVAGALALLSFAACAADPALKIGDPAPALEPMAWIKGEPVKKFAPGRVYVIEFWATWCVPCKELMPHLSDLQRKHADKLTEDGRQGLVRHGHLLSRIMTGIGLCAQRVREHVGEGSARIRFSSAILPPMHRDRRASKC